MPKNLFIIQFNLIFINFLILNNNNNEDYYKLLFLFIILELN